jgi:RimJ/RimL family protein N-acetyltransferase
MTLRPATLADIDFILATERQPGFEHLVARSSREQHQAALTAPGCRTLIGTHHGQPAGFAMFTGLDDPHGNLYLRRIAVAHPDAGFGRVFLQALLGWAFTETAAHRFWLTMFADNARAGHVYRACGLRPEGVQRAAYRLADGSRVDLAQMSITRPEWQDRPE